MSAMDIEKAAQVLFNGHHKSVVLVLRKKPGGKLRKIGTGFVIGRKGNSCLVMTCHHCITNGPKYAYEYSARLPGENTEYQVEKVQECADADIAILHVRGVTRECPPLQFRDSYDLSCETSVFLLGYVIPTKEKEERDLEILDSKGRTLTLFPAVSPLRISKPHRQNGPGVIEDIACTGASKNGSSGSPIILGHDVIGILIAGELDTQHCTVRPSETINKVLKSWLQLPENNHVPTAELIDTFVAKLGE